MPKELTLSIEPKANPGSAPMFGVSLEQYAGVVAALDEPFTLDAILGSEGLTAVAWARAERAWKVRIAKGGADGPLLAELRAKRAVAEDCLVRKVGPVDTELGAWLGFLRAYGESASPLEGLRALGLGLNDLSRLQRAWSRRMEADASLQKQAAELRARGVEPLPALRIEPVVLKPFPWSRGVSVAALRAAATPSTAARAPVPPMSLETSLAPGKLRLYAYVAVKARLAEAPGTEARILAELQIADFATTDAGWQARLRDDPELARDYRTLLQAQRAKLRAVAATLVTMGRTPDPAGEVPSSMPQRPPPPADAPTTAAAPGRPAAGRLQGTALALDLPGKALPFAPGLPLASPRIVVPDAPRPSRPSLAGTALALDVPRKAALPFARAPSASVPPSSAEARSPSAGRDAAEPDASAATQARLTLEQHASLTCDIADAPHQALDTLARYGLTPADKVAADAHYRDRFAREPAAKAAWESACQTYRAYLATRRITR